MAYQPSWIAILARRTLKANQPSTRARTKADHYSTHLPRAAPKGRHSLAPGAGRAGTGDVFSDRGHEGWDDLARLAAAQV